MFEYDDGLLTEKIWGKYVESLETIVRLEAQLQVAAMTVTRLREVLDLQAGANEDNNYLIHRNPDSGSAPEDD